MPVLTRDAIQNYNAAPLVEGLLWMLRSREAWTLHHGANTAEVTGMGWQGLGEQGAEARVTRDEAIAYEVAAVVQAGGSTAQFGAGDLMAMKSSVLEAIAVAEAEEFRVNQDLSVTDTMTGLPAAVRQQRQRLAEGHARYIAKTAEAFYAADQKVATAIDGHRAALDGHVRLIAVTPQRRRSANDVAHDQN